MRFVYLGPPSEPRVYGTQAFGMEWVRGVPVEVSDPGIAARLARHPHFAAEVDVAEDAGAGDDPAPVSLNVPEPAPVKKRGRPKKAAV